MSKILGNFTIIPDRLYVNRQADSQLANVIGELGRPAYVLVARQMGKTNLLLHAKRSLEEHGDAFVYIDASNAYDTLQEFFHSIIDLALLNPIFEGQTRQLIAQRRLGAKAAAAHRDHDGELRELLSAIPGRLVIFIDEVDALGTTPYADKVFAHIRSIYFSGRTNFVEFTRLTYVLSGVAEPSELIKNKDISPFNIGQKIYLDDFSRAEFSEFIQKSNLQITKEVEEKIFSWASGNPRITWDICSLVEDLQTSRQINVSPIDIDSIVEKHYLTKFDIPPIDHIRTLVKADSDIRDALMSIHWGKTQSISGSVRNKLYLAGIVSLGDDENRALIIRNRILSASLSEKWLRELDVESNSLLRRADDAVTKKLWSEAFDLYEEYLASRTNTDNDAIIRYTQGLCLFYTQEYKQAAHYLTLLPIAKSESATSHFASLYRLGLSYYLSGDLAASRVAFEKVLLQDSSQTTYFYYEALVNLAAGYLNDINSYDPDKVITLNAQVIQSEPKIREIYSKDIDVANRVINAARWNLVQVYKRQGNRKLEAWEIELALESKDPSYLVSFYREKAALQESSGSRLAVLEDCARTVISQKLHIEREDKLYPTAFTRDNCARLLSELAEDSDRPIFSVLLDYLRISSVSDMEAICSMAGIEALSKGHSIGAARLLTLAYMEGSVDAPSKDRRFTATLALLVTPSEQMEELEQKYFSEFLEPEGSTLISTDFRLIYGVVTGYIESNLVRAQEILRLADRRLNRGSNTQVFVELARSVIDVLWIDVLLEIGETTQCISRIQRTASELAAAKNTPVPPYFSEDIADTLLRRLGRAAYRLRSIPAIRRDGPKIGRNQFISAVGPDGTIVRGKYKTLIDKIQNEGYRIDEIDLG